MKMPSLHLLAIQASAAGSHPHAPISVHGFPDWEAISYLGGWFFADWTTGPMN